MKQIDVNIELSNWQHDVYDAVKKYRFITVSAGRQSGKTYFASYLITETALSKPGSYSMWVAPIYKQARKGFREVRKRIKDIGIIDYVKVKETELRIELWNGSVIEFRSADNEDSLRGETVTGLMVVDEAAMIKGTVYDYALEAMLAVSQAPALFISTPKAKNWFFDLYVRGKGESQDYKSFQFSSNASPFFRNEEFERLRTTKPARVFQQEYLAQFLDNFGSVFRDYRSCIHGALEQPQPGKKYIMGVDLAKTEDFTVITVLDQSNHVCHWERFNQLSWTTQRERIVNVSRNYNAPAIVDATGVGDAICEELKKQIKVVEYKFTNQSKRAIIEAMQIAIEQREISYPDIPELMDELNLFEIQETTAGKITYNAPPGYHDDTVISLALANYHNRRPGFEFVSIGADGLIHNPVGNLITQQLLAQRFKR